MATDLDDVMVMIAAFIGNFGYGVGGAIAAFNLFMSDKIVPYPLEQLDHMANVFFGGFVILMSHGLVQWASADRTICTRCHEKVKAEAKVCKHCGVNFNN